jgi:hypothetical protein
MSNRPRIGKINDATISKDIENFASRSKAIRNRTASRNDFGLTCRSDPSSWKDNNVVSRNAVHSSKKAELFGESWAVDEVPGPKYTPSIAAFKSHKCAPFSRGNRFERGKFVAKICTDLRLCKMYILYSQASNHLARALYIFLPTPTVP